MRLIDADAVLDTLDCGDRDLWVKYTLDEAPTIEAEPAKHGRWEPHMSIVRTPFAMNYDCSVCGSEGFGTTNYCPNCGARMDGEPNG